jgi:hypothetical protein
MRGWKEWYDDDEEEVWRVLAGLSPEEEEVVREFNCGAPLPDDDKQERKGWAKDELPF